MRKILFLLFVSTSYWAAWSVSVGTRMITIGHQFKPTKLEDLSLIGMIVASTVMVASFTTLMQFIKENQSGKKPAEQPQDTEELFDEPEITRDLREGDLVQHTENKGVVLEVVSIQQTKPGKVKSRKIAHCRAKDGEHVVCNTEYLEHVKQSTKRAV
jgi:hypothetical protein